MDTLMLFVLFQSAVLANCNHPIYCQGPILEVIQNAAIFSDSKTFVDMPMKAPLVEIEAAFANLPPGYNISQFVDQYFHPAGHDLTPVVPTDWQEEPELFKYIVDPKAKELATFVNAQWLELIRQFNDSYCEGCHSHIKVDHPFVIAGSRFREYYYWDTYWSLDGLLISGMSVTAKGVINNFLSLVSQIGFIPNGGRIYYLNRSQPPLLIQMVALYNAYKSDTEFLKTALPVLDMEYNYWMANHSIALDPDNTLNRYYVINSYPRPEAYLNDVHTAANLEQPAKEYLYQQLATTAESGWDFSTRWMTTSTDLASLTTTNIIPLDLNCILYANEQTMARLYESLGNTEKGKWYRDAALRRLSAIQKYLWNEETLSWNDYNVATKQQTVDFYASEFTPFWAGVYEVLPRNTISKVIEKLLPIFFEYPAGIPASQINSGQQWDYPNGWAPLHFFAVEGFRKVMNSPDWEDHVISRQVDTLSHSVINEWITTTYCAMKENNFIFEKYNVEKNGKFGSGGEYVVQSGFGWTNGVVLRFISQRADDLIVGPCESTSSSVVLAPFLEITALLIFSQYIM